jgi:endonuclease YncB( thermonuclease family)
MTITAALLCTLISVTAQGRDVGQAMLRAGAAKEWPFTNTGRQKERRPEWRGCK